MNISTLCTKINLQPEIANQVIKYDMSVAYGELRTNLNKLMNRNTWDEGLKALKQQLGEDPAGIKILTCMLHNAATTYDKCVSAGISEDIMVETMKAFSRFVNEHMASYGTYGFDRDFWTSRQAGGVLFRIGELEYELIEDTKQYTKTIGLHIPSDANIAPEKIQASLSAAKEFLNTFYKDYADAPMLCDSWLLSPALKELLPKGSNIICFQNLFEITHVEWDAPDVMEWVFKNPHIELKDAPEETTLQRKMKSYMLQGGKIGVGFGRIRP